MQHGPMTKSSARANFRPPPIMARLFVTSFLGLLFAVACNRDPGEIREWRPADHRHQTEETPAEQPMTSPQVSGSAEPSVPGLEEVTIAAYRRACATCHGQLGRGDGPQGPMVQARDLSDPAWQASVTDQQLADSILHGRGRMPPSGLPPDTVQGLVHLVRLFNRTRFAPPPPSAPSASAAAAPSGTPNAAAPPSAPSVSADTGSGRNTSSSK